MRIEKDTCTDYGRSSRLEWLATNGTGAFAMGTVAGANTRRYHGLLVTADRWVLLSKYDEELVVDGRAHALGTNQYPGAVHPAGFQQLSEFRLAPYPVWTYQVESTRLEKRVFLAQGEQAVVAEYRADRPCRLLVRPFLAFRGHHALAQANDAFNSSVMERERTIQMQPYPGLPALSFHHNGAVFQAGGVWYYSFEYLEELERGLDFREDLFCPGAFVFDLAPQTPAWIVAGLRIPTSWEAPPEGPLVAADQFLVRRPDGRPTIIAGYPWFADWGRDTMISLPGLLLARGRRDEARQILQGFLEHLRQGLIPNRFTDRDGAPEYNTADSALWMFQAVWALGQAGEDVSWFYPAAREIVDWHQRGTLHGIGVDPADGLLAAGDEHTQLTWMDTPHTPRRGKPVEINALWYNALRMLETWARRGGEPAGPWWRAARRVKASFTAGFWNPGRNCLYDVLTPAGPDEALRPNQIFAVSLPFALLDRERGRAVVRAVQSQLLTRFGLRTLAPGEPGYQKRYQGGPAERDQAYHQGTVWPWLVAPFVKACLRAFGRSQKNLAYCRSLVDAFEPEREHGCLGTIGELYDAEPPHRSCGAPAQAWSVAALAEALTALETTAAAPSRPKSPPGRRRKAAGPGRRSAGAPRS